MARPRGSPASLKSDVCWFSGTVLWPPGRQSGVHSIDKRPKRHLHDDRCELMLLIINPESIRDVFRTTLFIQKVCGVKLLAQLWSQTFTQDFVPSLIDGILACTALCLARDLAIIPDEDRETYPFTTTLMPNRCILFDKTRESAGTNQIVGGGW